MRKGRGTQGKNEKTVHAHRYAHNDSEAVLGGGGPHGEGRSRDLF